MWKEVTQNELVVVAPVPWFPKTKLLQCFKKWHEFSQAPREEVIEGIQVYHPRYFTIPKMGMFLYGYLMGLSMLRFVMMLYRQYKFDLIDAHFVYPDGVAARMISKKLGIPYVISARGTDINHYPKLWTIHPQIKNVLNKAAQVIAVSLGLKNIMTSNLGILPNKITVIGNGVDSKKFYPIDKMEARQYCGLPSDKTILLSVGALIPRKNYLAYLMAIKRLNDPNIFTVIIGEGEDRLSLENYIEQNGLAGRVLMPGSVPHAELVWWYSAADLFCHPSMNEGWPNVLMESLACGLPIVATPSIGSDEIIVDETVGLLTDGFKSEDIAAPLRKALCRNWDRVALRKKAEERGWNLVAAEVQSVFDEALNN